MLTNTKKLKDQKGFTIIEVLIVLAIAALILLIVFLAVPALQRSARNNSRKNDAGRIAAATSNFVSNHNGSLPSVAADVTTIITDAGNLSAYPGMQVSGTLATAAKGKMSLVDGSSGAVAAITVDGLQLVTGAKCDPATLGATLAGTTRQISLQYVTETSSGLTGLCQDI